MVSDVAFTKQIVVIGPAADPHLTIFRSSSDCPLKLSLRFDLDRQGFGLSNRQVRHISGKELFFAKTYKIKAGNCSEPPALFAGHSSDSSDN
jgi:hypothetical protein